MSGVQSGIDFSTLKRLKQLEQERDVLQQGLVYLEKANEWYLKQLDTSNEKISLLNKGAPTSVTVQNFEKIYIHEMF